MRGLSQLVLSSLVGFQILQPAMIERRECCLFWPCYSDRGPVWQFIADGAAEVALSLLAVWCL